MTRGESIIIDTPDGIAFYRLAALKGALSLQTKGMRLSRGTSATAIGKRDYGMTKNTATGQLPIVEEVVEAIQQFRECAPALQEHIGRALSGAVNHCNDEGWPVTLRNLDRALRHEDLTPAELSVAVGLAKVYLFEQGAKPAVRVVFRVD